MKHITIAMVLALAAPSVASAGGQKDSIGVGAEAQLSGLGGASMNFDTGPFHVGGFLGFADTGGSRSIVSVGARFYYHLHSTAMSDFGLGGSIGIASVPAGANDRNTFVLVEPSFQIRAFVTSNVALSFSGGIIVGVIDADGVFVNGQSLSGSGLNIGAGGSVGLTGGAGVHYYFF